ncbi:MAG: hypothetical protein GXP42_18740 [Chloroflexi bacterium]|nr:hypothetical protein [Chloroflexota bacterium]
MSNHPTSVRQTGSSPLERLLHILALTEERELTCEEVSQLTDYYAELEQAGESVQQLFPGVTQHLRICPECAEEYRALRRVIGMNGDA